MSDQGSDKHSSAANENPLTVYLFNVGQGDHMLLELPNQKFGIIDCNYESEINISNEPPALTYLRKRHQPESPVVLSFIYISHPDRDHTKGLMKLLDWIDEEGIDVERLWLYAGINEPDIHKALAAAVKCIKQVGKENLSSDNSAPEGMRNNSELRRLADDLKRLQEFIEKWRPRNPNLIQGIARLDKLAHAVEICMMAPLSGDIRSADDKVLKDLFLWTQHQKEEFNLRDRNLLSSVIKMSFGEHQLLFGGDTGEEVWLRCLAEFNRLHEDGEGPCAQSCRANFVKVSHHGSHNSSSLELWEQIVSEGAHLGISAGKGKHHPHRDTLRHISSATRALKRPPQVLTTNICDKCLTGQKLDSEYFPWLPRTPRMPRKEKTKEAVAAELPRSPRTRSESTKDSALVREALDREIVGKQIDATLTLNESLAAYVFRFSPNSSDIKVTKALTPTRTVRGCIFKHTGGKYFPDCA